MNKREKSWLFILILPLLLSCKGGGRYYSIPSEAMGNTIRMGQSVYVNSTDVFQRNDIACFEIYADDYAKPLPYEHGQYAQFAKTWQRWIKRIIAVSGDELYIKKGDVFLNDKAIPPPPLALEEYDVYTSVPIEEFNDDNENDFTPTVQTRGDTFIYRRYLTGAEVEDFRNRKPAYISVNKIIMVYQPGDTVLAKPALDTPWSVDNYGPLRVPKIGDTVFVDQGNYKLYQHIPGIQMGKNVIREQLYFMMGDNRHASMDSRYIGFISHSKMKGIVKL